MRLEDRETADLLTARDRARRIVNDNGASWQAKRDNKKYLYRIDIELKKRANNGYKKVKPTRASGGNT